MFNVKKDGVTKASSLRNSQPWLAIILMRGEDSKVTRNKGTESLP
jgi:hypothetical protein